MSEWSDWKNAYSLTPAEKKILIRILVVWAYTIPLWILGAPFWKSLTFGIMIAFLFAAGWGERWISRGAVILLAIAAPVWLELIPPPTQWRAAVTNIVAEI